MTQRPQFFIVGAPKAGTSSLAFYLGQHPKIFMPKRKDVPFFGDDLVHTFPESPRTMAEYEAQFDVPSDVMAGDACVQYLCSATAARDIKGYQPEAKIIIMLRDPVELMYSLHSHNLWMMEEDVRDFATALEAEPTRRQGAMLPPTNHFPKGLLYREIGHLYPQVQRFLDEFGNDRVHVIIYDEFKQDTEATTRATFRFLGVPEDVPLCLKVRNANRRPRNASVLAFTQTTHPHLERIYRRLTPPAVHGKLMPLIAKANANETGRAPLSPLIEAELRSEFVDDVRALGDVLGKDLTNWLPAA